MSDDETTNHQTISMHILTFSNFHDLAFWPRKNSKRSKTSCGGSFKPVNQFTSLAYQEYHGESRRYPKRLKDFKMRRICFTMERQWQLFDTARAKQHCRWHLEENSCTSLVRFKDIPKTNWRWGFFNPKRSRRNKKSGSTRSKWLKSMWVCKWNFRNSEATDRDNSWQALQCNQVSVRVLFAISRCDHRQNKPMGGEDAKCVRLRGWFLGLDASCDIHQGTFILGLEIHFQNWSESTPTVMYLHLLHLLCRADVSPKDVAASENTLVGRCILPASWDAHREVV